MILKADRVVPLLPTSVPRQNICSVHALCNDTGDDGLHTASMQKGESYVGFGQT